MSHKFTVNVVCIGIWYVSACVCLHGLYYIDVFIVSHLNTFELFSGMHFLLAHGMCSVINYFCLIRMSTLPLSHKLL